MFKLRPTRGERRLLEKTMGAGDCDWQDAGQGWWGRKFDNLGPLEARVAIPRAPIQRAFNRLGVVNRR